MGYAHRLETPQTGTLSDWVAPDCHGLNFYDIDQSLQDLLSLYMDDDLRTHMILHYRRLGDIVGGRLDTAARLADRRDPVLHHRDAMGQDEDWLEFHPAYREMEEIGFHEFGIHCMSRTPGVLGWPERVPALAKYVFQYLLFEN